MGLAELQRLFGQLSTDPVLRARFAADPRAVANEFGLDDAGSEQLSSLPAGQIDRFAEALVAKRRNEAEKLLPGIHRALGPARFAALFRRHALTYVPTGLKRHRADALRFAAFVAREARREPAWLVDLARLEFALLAANDASARLLARRFRYAPDDLARIGQLGSDAVPAPLPRPTLCVWFRASRHGRACLLRLSAPQARWFRSIFARARPGRS